MRYALLLIGNEAGYAALSPEESKEIYARHDEFGAKFGEKLRGGAELRPSDTATTVRRQGGEVLVTDGPFAETAEQLGGFYIVEAADQDEALAIAREVPTIPGDAVEVRPLVAH